ncbi:hypothetical protein N7462_003742 [Penicillium macrosclerotiorum]|uniref:uncharacterized protein n=1 Tax=Penicillium macrosclerotiorum TaxID=303699 RepID=UPI002547CA11|nr:uncharacterized protein N7462_003742 [Penicillium macrosclerotiorum]KAJ5689350.1 hypothetical protein N7462_003742 [Penicillium macrosclerotiorum]
MLLSRNGLSAAAVMSALVAPSSALNADLKTNVAVYYGQGAYQPRLSHFCEETSLDIINLGFINVFPESVGGYPGSNFGNQCDGNVYAGTQLLSGCHQIWEDIPVCKALGKTIMLSLGGETAYQKLEDELTAIWFADFLWYSFGPENPNYTDVYPRPFLDNSVDGFDFDIEHDGGYGYAIMINRLRTHFEEYPDQTFYISGAPQCTIPDEQLSNAISDSVFDFIWVQFYNTPACSARSFFNGTGDFNYGDWVDVILDSANPSAKLFIGLPAAEGAAATGDYLTPAEAYLLVDVYMNLYPDTFGGIMLWEATASDNNTSLDGLNYAQNMKRILYDFAPPPPPPPPVSTITRTVTPTPYPTPTHTPSSSKVPTSSPVTPPVLTLSSSPAVSSTSHAYSSTPRVTDTSGSSTHVVISSSIVPSSIIPSSIIPSSIIPSSIIPSSIIPSSIIPSSIIPSSIIPSSIIPSSIIPSSIIPSSIIPSSIIPSSIIPSSIIPSSIIPSSIIPSSIIPSSIIPSSIIPSSIIPSSIIPSSIIPSSIIPSSIIPSSSIPSSSIPSSSIPSSSIPSSSIPASNPSHANTPSAASSASLSIVSGPPVHSNTPHVVPSGSYTSHTGISSGSTPWSSVPSSTHQQTSSSMAATRRPSSHISSSTSVASHSVPISSPHASQIVSPSTPVTLKTPCVTCSSIVSSGSASRTPSSSIALASTVKPGATGERSSSLPGKSTHTSGASHSSSSHAASSLSKSIASSSTSGAVASSSSDLSRSTTVISSRSSISRRPSRTPTTRTPVSSPAVISTSGSGSSSVSDFEHTSASSVSGSSSTQQSTGHAGPTGSGSVSVTSVTDILPSVTPAPSTTRPEVTTTIIVTSYTDICPTGFTTITTTYTTTFCPGSTASATGHPSGEVTTTASIPEGWSTTVTVCTQCAATPTTVTLTKPISTAAAQTTTSVFTSLATETWTETWTTILTFCKHCGPTGSTVTLTVPYTPSASAPVANPTGASGTSAQSEGSVSSGLPQITGSGPGGVSSEFPSSRPHITASRSVHPPSHTPLFAVHTSGTAGVPTPSSTWEETSPAFTNAASPSGLINLLGISLALLASTVFLL